MTRFVAGGKTFSKTMLIERMIFAGSVDLSDRCSRRASGWNRCSGMSADPEAVRGAAWRGPNLLELAAAHPGAAQPSSAVVKLLSLPSSNSGRVQKPGHFAWWPRSCRCRLRFRSLCKSFRCDEGFVDGGECCWGCFWFGRIPPLLRLSTPGPAHQVQEARQDRQTHYECM